MATIDLGRALRTALILSLVILGAMAATARLAAAGETTSRFAGVKVNAGTVMHSTEGGRSMLTLSADFVVPDTPDPHWQVVDSKGATYLLERLPIKGDKVNRTIAVPAYVPDVARVQIWCAYAETLLGEAAFVAPVR